MFGFTVNKSQFSYRRHVMGTILSCAPSLQFPKRLGVQPTCPGGNGIRPSPYIFLPGNQIGSKESHPKCGNQTKCGRERSGSDAQETWSFHYCYRRTWGRSHLRFNPSLLMRNRTRRSPVSQLVAVARRRFLGTTPNIPVTLFSYPQSPCCGGDWDGYWREDHRDRCWNIRDS